MRLERMMALVLTVGFVATLASWGQEPMEQTSLVKTQSAFYPLEIVERARKNAERYEWAAAMKKDILQAAEPWRALSNDELWAMIFGPTITRSWMVWSNGYCPACKKDVRMYAWEIDPFKHPWKVRCPNCGEFFPKNDFAAFYQSGMDEHGIFQPSRADRSLLFNTEHPDPNDPLHLFGVDDGEGYVAEGHRWRFIGCYLIYGQWKKLIWSGLVNLSAAYLVTGDPEYAIKTVILLDRLADIFPQYDFSKQGEVYEDPKLARGQITQWHDACSEMFRVALAYDRVFEEARKAEAECVAFLSEKAARYGIANPKRCWADIQRNIEQGLFHETLAHRDRIESNYPWTDVTMITLKTVLAWPTNREEIYKALNEVLLKATAVDGVSGEKGLDGYGRMAPNAVASWLGLFTRLEPTFLKMVYEQCPALHDMYRFHLDTWCMDEWYPRSGDTGTFGKKNPNYAGVTFSKTPGVEPSMATFLWDLYSVTNDVAFAQLIYKLNDHSVDGLPYDLFCADPAVFQEQLQKIIEERGAEIPRGSINKQAWHLAILRSGQGEHQRALWLDYDSYGSHGHADALNLGLYAKGLDLMPDFGYPPVGYGGWTAPKAVWYKIPASHNTVVVDGKDQARQAAGTCTLWALGERFRAVRAACPDAVDGCEEFERTAILIDVSPEDFYVIDAFFVVGGKQHTKFFHSFFGELAIDGLQLQPCEPYNYEAEMRNYRGDMSPAVGWSVDWRLSDPYGYLPPGREVHVRYTDLTPKCSAGTAEAWIETTLYGQGQETWIPRVWIQRNADTPPLRSAFVSVIEPYETKRFISQIRRLSLETPGNRPLPEDFVGIEVSRADGGADVCLLVDGRGPADILEPQHDIEFRGEIAWVSYGKEGLDRLVVCQGDRIRVGKYHISGACLNDFVELVFLPDGVHMVAGKGDTVPYIVYNGDAVPVIDDRKP